MFILLTPLFFNVRRAKPSLFAVLFLEFLISTSQFKFNKLINLYARDEIGHIFNKRMFDSKSIKMYNS